MMRSRNALMFSPNRAIALQEPTFTRDVCPFMTLGRRLRFVLDKTANATGRLGAGACFGNTLSQSSSLYRVPGSLAGSYGGASGSISVGVGEHPTRSNPCLLLGGIADIAI